MGRSRIGLLVLPGEICTKRREGNSLFTLLFASTATTGQSPSCWKTTRREFPGNRRFERAGGEPASQVDLEGARTAEPLDRPGWHPRCGLGREAVQCPEALVVMCHRASDPARSISRAAHRAGCGPQPAAPVSVSVTTRNDPRMPGKKIGFSLPEAHLRQREAHAPRSPRGRQRSESPP